MLRLLIYLFWPPFREVLNWAVLAVGALLIWLTLTIPL